MIDFIEMWLLLRGLSDQRKYQIRTTEYAGTYYKANLRPHIERHRFAVAMSNHTLAFYYLPQFLRLKLRKSSPVSEGEETRNTEKLSKIYELLDCAEPKYIVVHNPNEEEDAEKRAIRLTTATSTNPDDYGTHFVSVGGGIEAFVKRFPRTWILLGVVLSPKWLPLLGGLLCQFNPVLNWCRV